MFAKRYGRVFEGDEKWQAMGKAKPSLTYRWNSGSTYVQNPPYFEGISANADADRRRDRRPRPGPVPGQHHHRPHLARRLDQEGRPGRHLPDRAPGAPERLQLLRRAPRQPQRHDARHLRQRAHQEHHDGRQGGRQHHPLSLRRGHVDLRRGHALQGRGRAAGRVRRQGIRHRLQPRLGRQGHAAARHARRRSPSRSSASTARTWSAWACCRWCSSEGSPGRRSASPATRRSPSAALPTSSRARSWPSTITSADGKTTRDRGALPHRYRGGAGLLPPRRHPAVRAAQPGRAPLNLVRVVPAKVPDGHDIEIGTLCLTHS